MKTVLDLCKRALSLVGAIGAGQAYSAEDLQVARLAVRPMIDELSAAKVMYLAVDPHDDDIAEIPEYLFHPLANLLAIEIGPEFGAPFDAAGREVTIGRLRFLNATDGYGATMTSEYY